MEKITVDVAIIAAGPAGLAAAAQAAEDGLKVAVFEKANVAGGAANMGMGPFAVESKLQQRGMVNLTKEEAFKKFMDYNHWKVDAKIVHDYFWKSAETIDWLMAMGVEFFAAMKNFPESEPTWHVVKPENGVPGMRCAGAMARKMVEHCNELGVQFFYSTPATKILTEDGKVTGVLAKGADGTEYQADAKAVIIATGGFATNPEMVKEYTGYTVFQDMFDFMIPGITGDGLRMAWEAGAGKGRMMMEKIPGFTIAEAAIGQLPQVMLFFQGGPIAVNKLGKRVASEEAMQNHSVCANIIDIQPERSVYRIADEKMVRYYSKHGLDFPSEVMPGDPTENFDEEWTQAAARYPGNAFVADSIADLARQIGMPAEALEETIEEYNDMCNEKYDEFGKNRRYLVPFRGGKLYAYRMSIGAYGSLGGIKINSDYEVVTEDWKVIEGLYAAGNDACEIYNGTYDYFFPGNTMGFALNSGRIAAENAADYIRRK
ncbi:MAG: FAD-dependent oxidoreductase [Parasporobacterium sp.]|nr:FAD-dependent oxidoreductase [Parasporobacterium sp.]